MSIGAPKIGAPIPGKITVYMKDGCSNIIRHLTFLNASGGKKLLLRRDIVKEFHLVGTEAIFMLEEDENGVKLHESEELAEAHTVNQTSIYQILGEVTQDYVDLTTPAPIDLTSPASSPESKKVSPTSPIVPKASGIVFGEEKMVEGAKKPGAEVSSFAAVFQWPPNTLFVDKVPLDVNGTVVYGTHIPSLVKSSEGKIPMQKNGWWVTNHTWSHGGGTTNKFISNQCEKQGIKPLIRSGKCCGEFRCMNTECPFVKTFFHPYIMEPTHLQDTAAGKPGPTCPKCNQQTKGVACSATQQLVRIDLPEEEGHLLVYRHGGQHGCTVQGKKGGTLLSPDTR